jgi:hypothetical protein
MQQLLAEGRLRSRRGRACPSSSLASAAPPLAVGDLEVKTMPITKDKDCLVCRVKIDNSV